MKAKIIELLNKYDLSSESFETLADDIIKLFSEDKPPEYEYYMHRKGVFYFRNGEVKLKQTPDLSDATMNEFYDSVKLRGYGVKYVLVNY